MMCCRFICLALALCACIAPICLADEAETKPQADNSPVVATVNGEPIRRSQIDAALAAVDAKQLSSDALAKLQAEALERLIDRKLVVDSLSAGGKGVPDAEVDAAIGKVKTQLEGQKTSLDKFLADKHLTEAALRDQIAWQLLWERNMQKHLNDKVLEAYFDAHRREFDGSEVRASHILFRPEKAGDTGAAAALTQKAAEIREQLESGKLKFADAAAKYSAGPSRAKGGDVGFFPRHGVMAEPFAAAAFALEKDQVSQPVVTPFGVHLIKMTDIKPGSRKWTNVREQLKPLAAQTLFDKLASREREKAQIEFTGVMPHFKPGDRELVMPGDSK